VLFLRSLLTPDQQKTLDSLRMNPGCMGGPGMGMEMGKPGRHGHDQHAPGKDRHEK
jgi:hypothetical protein